MRDRRTRRLESSMGAGMIVGRLGVVLFPALLQM